MKHPEQTLQRSVAQYLDLVLDRSVVWSAIGHGGGGKIRGAMLKGMGLKPGVPDLYISWRERHNPNMSYQGDFQAAPENYGTLWLELKADKGKQSAVQKQFQTRVEWLYHRYNIVKSIDDVAAALKDCGVPTRAKR